MRHLEKYRAGHRFDDEDGQEHMSSVAWCAFALLWQDAQPQEVTTVESPFTLVFPAVSSKQDAVAEALDTPLCGKRGCQNPNHQRDAGPPVRY